MRRTAAQNRVKSFDRNHHQESGKKFMAWESDYNGGREGASKYRFLLVSGRRRDVTAWREYGYGTKVGYKVRRQSFRQS